MSDVFDFKILAGEATLIIQDTIAKVIDGKAYQSSKVGEWALHCPRVCVVEVVSVFCNRSGLRVLTAAGLVSHPISCCDNDD